MTLALILFFIGIVVWRGCHQFAKAIEQDNYEKQRFRLLVAEELDRLDKMMQEAQQAERRSKNPSLWEMRN